MLSLGLVQNKLAFEVLNKFSKKIFESATLQSLIQPTQDFILEVAELALPDLYVVFRNKDLPP